ncbi:MAG: hypothetical protein CM1200mP27_08230 [Chloroflexota bacterium]|nr:MAG: hypothetical protein CM1200mP27_08230 [Chloroflexota bacterium]
MRWDNRKIRFPGSVGFPGANQTIVTRERAFENVHPTVYPPVSFPSASSVPTEVGVKNPPIPAAAHRIRSAKVPWGTNSASISSSFTCA